MCIMQKCMSTGIAQFSLSVWRSKMCKGAALESSANREKLLNLLSEKWVLHRGLI